MASQPRTKARAFLALIATVALLLGACIVVATPTITPTPIPTLSPTPTSTPLPPTATPTPKPTPTFTPIPLRSLVTPAPTPTSTPVPSTPTSTPNPTTAVTPAPAGTALYENERYGFAIRYPENWVETEGSALDLLLELQGEAKFPRVLVALAYLAETQTLEEAGQEYLDSLLPTLPGMQLLSRGEAALADGTPAYELVFDFQSGGTGFQAKVILVLRGTQRFEIFSYSPQADFLRRQEEIDQTVYSFQLREPRPFGIDRSQALTLVDSGPSTLDPAIVSTSGDHLYVSQIFGGLLTLDRNLALVPDLAQSWEVSGDGTVFTFSLRRDATFHNGRPVTAQDFQFSLERAADPATGSKTAGTYLNDILGVEEKLEGQAKEIAGVVVVDDYTLQLRTDAAKAYFLAKLTYPTAFVVDRNNVAFGPDWYLKPNGTGPFKLALWNPDELLILERNDAFYRGAAKVQHIVFRLFGGIPIQMYETNEIDVAYVGLGDLERVMDPTNSLNAELQIYPELSIHYVGLNSQAPPFDDPLVRKAFALALDRDRLVEVVLKNAVRKASGFLPPGMPAYDADLPALPYDPTQARELIAQSSYGSVENLTPLVYTAAGYIVSDTISAEIAMWKENLGVDVQVDLVDPYQYYDILGKTAGNFFSYGWIADYPDPQNFLDVLLHSQAQNNIGKYNNPQVDALLEEARIEGDGQRRIQLYQEAERLLVEDVAAIPLWYDQSYVLVKPYVKEWYISAQGLPDFVNVRLERP